VNETPEFVGTSESRPPSEMTQEAYQQSQRNAALWNAMNTALANCEAEMAAREQEYQKAMLRTNRAVEGDE